MIDRMIELRHALDLSQRAMGDLLGIPVRTIEDWERRVSSPPEYVLRLLVDKLERMRKGKRKPAKSKRGS